MSIQKTPKAPIRILKPVRGLKAGDLVTTMSKHNARLLVMMHFAEWAEVSEEAPVVPAATEEPPKRRRRAYKRRDMQAEQTTDIKSE